MLHEALVKKILGTLPQQLRESRDLQIFAGKAAMPVKGDNIEQMRQRITKIPEAIGYTAEYHTHDAIAAVGVKCMRAPSFRHVVASDKAINSIKRRATRSIKWRDFRQKESKIS